MARSRKPTKVLEISGAFVKHPERKAARAGEPQVHVPLGPPSPTLDASEVERWHDFTRVAYWLDESHRIPCEIVARLWARMVRREATTAELKLLESTAAHLGLNPIDRTKISIAPEVQATAVEKYAT
jgi:hypothetical protein